MQLKKTFNFIFKICLNLFSNLRPQIKKYEVTQKKNKVLKYKVFKITKLRYSEKDTFYAKAVFIGRVHSFIDIKHVLTMALFKSDKGLNKFSIKFELVFNTIFLKQ